MPKHKKPPTISRRAFLAWSICFFVTTSLFLMAVPLWSALSVGIAALSIVIFGIGLVVSALLLFTSPPPTRIILLVSIVLSLVGLLVPQIVFLQTAKKHDARLSFNPAEYVQFSGETTIRPSKNIVYKTIGKETLELAYYPARQTGNRPVVALLHGGAWRYGSHLETGMWPQTLTDAGYTVISIEYRLAHDTYQTWRDAPRDVRDALRYLKTNAADLNIDGSRINLLGQSAGGHLALLEAYTSLSVDSVIALYAPIDLSLDYETSVDKSAQLDFIGGPPLQYSERYRSLSPLSYATSSSPRTLLLQGTHDDLVATRNATRLDSALSALNVSHKTIILPLTGHSFENQRGGFATQIAEQSVLRFLSE